MVPTVCGLFAIRHSPNHSIWAKQVSRTFSSLQSYSISKLEIRVSTHFKLLVTPNFQMLKMLLLELYMILADCSFKVSERPSKFAVDVQFCPRTV